MRVPLKILPLLLLAVFPAVVVGEVPITDRTVSNWARVSGKVGDPDDQPSLVEWMRGVEKAWGSKGTNTALTFLFTAGMGSVLQARDEASWPDSCKSGGTGFCPREQWDREVVHFYDHSHDFSFIALRGWCEAPRRAGLVTISRANRPGLRNTFNYFCEVDGKPVGAVIQQSRLYWWVIEPKLDSVIGFDSALSAFVNQGYRSSVAREVDRLQARRNEQQRFEDYQRGLERRQAERERKERVDVPRMRQIGAKICQTQHGSDLQGLIQFVGFTEGVSPDNGKIQVRVASASILGARDLTPSGFQPHVIWDDPMNWDLCE